MSDPSPGPILLVEDDEVFGDLIERYLRARGYAVVRQLSAEACVESLLDGLRPALVLLDVNLPGDTGWGVLRSDAYETAGSPPVVIVSATAVAPGRIQDYHVAGYLPKPFPLETFINLVERFVGKPRERASR